jgi:fumarate reductase subunit D
LSTVAQSFARPASRKHAGFGAFVAHRVSGVLLAMFLPMHFLALGLALEDEAALQRFVEFTDHPLVKLAEWGLVILLGLHLALGLRVVAIELGPWRGLRLAWIKSAVVIAALLGVAFLAVLAI